MHVIFFLVAVGILVAGGFLVAFIWSVKSGQYDDDYTPSVRMLFDNNIPDESKSSEVSVDKKKNQSEEAQLKKSNNNKS